MNRIVSKERNTLKTQRGKIGNKFKKKGNYEDTSFKFR